MQQRVHLAAGTTEVEFIWSHDRWQHEIRTSNQRTWTSVEGPSPGGAPEWPCSPVITEVSRVEVTGGPAVLGLGLAGRSHFSLCVTIHPELHDTLLVEAACRIHAKATSIGSTYKDHSGDAFRVEPENPTPTLPATVRWSYLLGPNGLQALPPARMAAGG